MSSERPPIERLEPSADGWHDDTQVDTYLRRIDQPGPRDAGEELLIELLPSDPLRVLDLGAGDGRVTALVLHHCPTVRRAVLVDNSTPMLRRARDRFSSDGRIQVVDHDITDQLPDLGTFDVILSAMALHHLEDERKRSLFAELATVLNPGGMLANLDVVASASPVLHAQFLAAINRTADDPEDRPAAVDDQLQWMRNAGLVNVDCQWRWRGFALMVGQRPGPPGPGASPRISAA